MQDKVLSEALSCPTFTDFLKDYLAKKLKENLFVHTGSTDWAFDRAFHDGQAMAYKNILDLIRTLTND